jgi:hypothetical protein
VLTFVAGEVVVGAVVYGWTVRMWPDTALTWPPMMIGAALLLPLLAAMVHAALWCLRATRPVTPGGRAPAVPA